MLVGIWSMCVCFSSNRGLEWFKMRFVLSFNGIVAKSKCDGENLFENAFSLQIDRY